MPERPSQNPEHLIAAQSHINGPSQSDLELDNSNEKYDDDKAPEGWLTPRSLQRLGIVSEYIAKRESEKYKTEHPEWIKLYKTPRGQGPFEHYSPELITEISKSLHAYEYAPDDWLTIRSLCHLLGRSRELVEREVEKYKTEHPEWIKKYKNSDNRVLEHISPELIEIIRSELTPESAPYGWKTPWQLEYQAEGDIILATYNTIVSKAEQFRDVHPEWFRHYKSPNSGKQSEYYSPELIQELTKVIGGAETAPRGWMTANQINKLIGPRGNTIRKFYLEVAQEHPEWKKVLRIHGKEAEWYAPEFIEELKKHYLVETAPQGWLTIRSFEHYLTRQGVGVGKKTLESLIESYLAINPEWEKKYKNNRGGVSVYYAPDLIASIEKDRQTDLAPSKEREQLQIELEGLSKEVQEGKTAQAQELQQLFNLFGHSNAIDILYKFDPRYKKLPVGYVKSILADYLGDFLVSRPLGDLNPEELNSGLRFLSESKFQNYLLEVIKNDVLQHYNKERVSSEEQNAKSIIKNYLDELRKHSVKFQNTHFDEVLSELESYYESMFSALKKPDNIVETMNGKRTFPDFYQQINIKEMSDKKKMLLADYMGVGKSASAILSKEYLNLKCGLVIAPSNVIDTWKGYLSDNRDQGGKQKGYFKEGQAPKVLEIENINDLKKIQEDGANFDYILISQEKLTQKYAEVLSKVDTDMLIIDEAHKLKNIKSGVRATTLLRLAKNIEGDDKYLALLSGTPIPNKVQDIAITLKLLYPEEFSKVKDKDLVRNIIDTDIIDLRAKLLPRMQMKELSGIEMPKLEEKLISLELSPDEQLIYEMLMEEDELTATDKLRILRQFLLNPELLDSTPNFESTKISSVGESLREAFQTKDKIVIFFNGYIENIIRGENTIIPHLNLSPDVEVRTITGQVSKEERKQIQDELKTSNKKILLLVSAATADVGVDLSAADHVMFYNEPWSKYDEAQQLGRVYRPGLKHDLESETFIVKDSIEEGIHLYTKAKEQAVEKLLRGIPRTEIEKKLLSRDEKQASQNLEVNPELARYYFSDWDKMMKIFAYVKEIGVEDFQNFLQKFGREYASCYVNLGSRSYQANADRVCGTLIDSLAKQDGLKPEDIKVLDIASGPEMLKKHIPEHYKDRVISMDINREHFKGEGDKRVVGSFLHLPFDKESVDFANFSLALHYTQFLPSRNNFERLEALLELNRVLKPGGKAVINMIYSLDFKDEESFREIVGDLGFKIIEGYSGNIEVGQNYKSKVITLEKEIDPLADGTTMKQITEQMGREKLNGLKLIENKVSVRDTRKIITEFAIGDKQFKVNFNRQDVNVLEEERDIIQRGESLKTQFGSIGDISKEQVIQNGFTRILIKDKYILFKKLEKAEGVAVIR